MMSFRAILTFSLSAILAASPAFAAGKHHSSHSKASSSRHATAHKTSAHRRQSRSHRLHGQQAIEPERVTQIQQALVREHYLNEEPNGDWDDATKAAMQKYQADQGWQTRLMPDSRALVKLGLGPDYSTAINAKDVLASAPAPSLPAGSAASSQDAGFAAAAGVNR